MRVKFSQPIKRPALVAGFFVGRTPHLALILTNRIGQQERRPPRENLEPYRRQHPQVTSTDVAIQLEPRKRATSARFGRQGQLVEVCVVDGDAPPERFNHIWILIQA